MSWVEIAWEELHVVIDFTGGVSACPALKLRVQCILALEALLTESGKSPDSPATFGRFLVYNVVHLVYLQHA
jgi:hypothetical protein